MARLSECSYKITKNLILIAIVIGLAALPLFMNRKAKFAGSDDQAAHAIAKLNTGYKPWFSPVWKPPGGEVESLLFALQAAIGAGIVGYGLGYLRGRKKKHARVSEMDK